MLNFVFKKFKESAVVELCVKTLIAALNWVVFELILMSSIDTTWILTKQSKLGLKYIKNAFNSDMPTYTKFHPNNMDPKFILRCVVIES